jgi:hypothetical protein
MNLTNGEIREQRNVLSFNRLLIETNDEHMTRARETRHSLKRSQPVSIKEDATS